MILFGKTKLLPEIYVPITPPPVWAPVVRDLIDMKVALASRSAGIFLRTSHLLDRDESRIMPFLILQYTTMRLRDCSSIRFSD